MKRRICVLTGTRAEYGLLKSLLEAIRSNPDAELMLVVTGSHLSPEFGQTEKEILNDGFTINHRLPILADGDGPSAITAALGNLIKGAGDLFVSDRPDIVVVLGDRYESFGFVSAALVHHIPVAHIHGGELTFGAIDDALRHAMTKMAWWHFTAAEDYKRRVLQLGEASERVFNVGAMANDSLARLKLQPKEELESSLGMELKGPLILGTFHPETHSPGQAAAHVEELLEGVLASSPGSVVWTMANADAEGRIINRTVEDFIQRHPQLNMKLFSSLGQTRYLSVMKLAQVVVGNSSSGVIEAPILGTATVNVGNRQGGRLRTPSIVDCAFDRQAISDAIHTGVRNKGGEHPFGTHGVAQQILQTLLKSEYPASLDKKFSDKL